MKIEDIQDRESLRAWLTEQDSYEITVTIAARAALRVQPKLWIASNPVRPKATMRSLPYFWSVITACSVVKISTWEVNYAAAHAANSARDTIYAVADAADAADAATPGFVAADRAAHAAQAAAQAAYAAADAIAFSASAAYAAARAATRASDAWSALRADCELLIAQKTVWLRPLWHGEKNEQSQDWAVTKSAWQQAGAPWDR
ncbi:MAG: hypothetical protein AAGF94_06035, partial [Pseudomonadota bacterium]